MQRGLTTASSANMSYSPPSSRTASYMPIGTAAQAHARLGSLSYESFALHAGMRVAGAAGAHS